MLEDVVAVLGETANQEMLSWLGGGLVVAAGGVWVVIKHFWPQKEPPETTMPGSTAPPTANKVSADRGGMAAGGDFTVDQSTHTNTGLDWVSLGVICAALLGAALLAAAFAGNTVTADTGSVAIGGDTSGSTISISSPASGDSK